MNTEQALVPLGNVPPSTNGNGSSPVLPAIASRSDDAAPKTATPLPAPEPLTDELVDKILSGRGIQGWWRAANIGRVLGLLTFYLFLDSYDIRAEFNQRMNDRRREESRG
jgi:hypothetical protein